MDKENKVMDFRIILHDNLQQNISDQSAATYQEDVTPDYTLTFVIGSCVLALFLLLGVVASTYLCLTLKKGTLLWVTDSNRQLNKDIRNDEHTEREESSVSLKGGRRMSSNQETTQV